MSSNRVMVMVAEVSQDGTSLLVSEIPGARSSNLLDLYNQSLVSDASLDTGELNLLL